MLDLISSSWLQELATSLVVSLVLFSGGFLLGKWRGRRSMRGRNLEQYDFYPFTVDADGFPQFSPQLFERGVKHLLRHADATAACQMILIGEQNGVRYQLGAGGQAPLAGRDWRDCVAAGLSATESAPVRSRRAARILRCDGRPGRPSPGSSSRDHSTRLWTSQGARH